MPRCTDVAASFCEQKEALSYTKITPAQIITLYVSRKERRLMSVLPRVTERIREQISREFDDLGPEACMAEIKADLSQHNPEFLDMASRWRGRAAKQRAL
jgi:hypothetical protein